MSWLKDMNETKTCALEPEFHPVLYFLFPDEFFFLHADADYAGLFGGGIED